MIMLNIWTEKREDNMGEEEKVTFLPNKMFLSLPFRARLENQRPF